MKTITEDEFYEQYKPVLNHIYNDEDATGFGGTMYETYGSELEYVKEVATVNEAFVWTVLDTGEGLCIVSGYHHINRFGYIITELPADQDMIDVVLEDLTDDINMDDEYGDGDDNIMGA